MYIAPSTRYLLLFCTYIEALSGSIEDNLNSECEVP